MASVALVMASERRRACRYCGTSLVRFSSDVLCVPCSHNRRCDSLATTFAAEAGEPVTVWHREIAAKVIAVFDQPRAASETLRGKGQRWCEGCQKYRFTGAWGLNGTCRYCSTVDPAARQAGQRFLIRRAEREQERKRQAAAEERKRQAAAHEERKRQAAAHEERVSRPLEGRWGDRYLHQVLGQDRTGQPFTWADKIASPDRDQPEVVAERNELLTTIRSIVGDLDEFDVMNLDEGRLMTLRLRLIEAGVAPQSYRVPEATDVVRDAKRAKAKRKGRFTRHEARRALLAEEWGPDE